MRYVDDIVTVEQTVRAGKRARIRTPGFRGGEGGFVGFSPEPIGRICLYVCPGRAGGRTRERGNDGRSDQRRRVRAGMARSNGFPVENTLVHGETAFYCIKTYPENSAISGRFVHESADPSLNRIVER